MTPDKYQEALDAIKEMFSDTSVPQKETARNLRMLKDEIDIMLGSLDL